MTARKFWTAGARSENYYASSGAGITFASTPKIGRAEHSVVFSGTRRGFCPNCRGRRMAESAALLVDKVLPRESMRQWVLILPSRLFAGSSDSFQSLMSYR